MYKEIHLFDLFGFNEFFRLEVRDLSRDTAGKTFDSRKSGNGSNSGPPRLDGFPVLFHPYSKRRYHAQTGDNDATVLVSAHPTILITFFPTGVSRFFSPERLLVEVENFANPGSKTPSSFF